MRSKLIRAGLHDVFGVYVNNRNIDCLEHVFIYSLVLLN